jgi:hypothetical protein
MRWPWRKKPVEHVHAWKVVGVDIDKRPHDSSSAYRGVRLTHVLYACRDCWQRTETTLDGHWTTAHFMEKP